MCTIKKIKLVVNGLLIKIYISDFFRKTVSFGLPGLSVLQGSGWLERRVTEALCPLSQSPPCPLTSVCPAPVAIWLLNLIPGFGKDVRATEP